ncbi:MAG: tetratricopeptide repeat protein [bacterium]|nr:tetratricopeptide repeat protein [bacterium]
MEKVFQKLKKQISLVVTIVFIVLGFALYANTFQVPIFWDDEDNITNNQYIKNWDYFPRFFSENLIAGAGLVSNYWRPMLLVIFSTGWHIWGDWPGGYHFINISLHIANAILLFLILTYLFKHRGLAFLTSSVFLVHPLQTEAITPATGTADPLWVLFAFLGIFFYLKFRISNKLSFQSGYYFLSLAMYVLALMSKEIAIIIPALIFISDFFFELRDEKTPFKEKLKKAGKTIWPFLVLAGFYILLRATVLNFQNTFNFYNQESNAFASHFYIRFFTFFRVLIVYLGLFFWPHNLHMERSVEIATSFFSLDVILGGLLFAGLLILAFTQFKRLPILSFGILWFFIGLAPTSNILVPINNTLYEHWLYLPLIGIFLILFWLGIVITREFRYQKIFLIIPIIFLVFLGYVTINRNHEWRDPITFYKQILKYTPNSYRVINNLGKTYAEAGDYQKAEIMYKKAINLDPAGPTAYHNLANIYNASQKEDLAEQYFRLAIKADPNFVYSYNALANMYLKNQKYREARQIFEDYLEYDKTKTNTLFLLAQIAVAEKDFKGALDYLEKALVIEPQNQIVQTAIQQILLFR